MSVRRTRRLRASREERRASDPSGRLRTEHTPEAIRTRLARRPPQSYMRDFVYGAVDGTVTTFAVVTGAAGADLERAVEVITADRTVSLETMLREELGLSSDTRSPRRAAVATFAAFVVVGFLPLAPFVYRLLGMGRVSGAFEASAAATAAAFFVVGAVKARFVEQRWWAEGLRTLALGSAAAVLANMAGTILHGIGGGG